MAQLAMISNMVAELQGPEGLGAMMLPKAMTAVFYTLAAVLIYTAWTFVQELSVREKERVVVEESAEAMTLYIAPISGARVHTRQSCRGLQNAGNVRTMYPCNKCCPNEFTRAEGIHHKAGRKFVDVKSKYFWFRTFLAVLLMVTAAQLLQAGHNFEKYLNNSSSAQEAPLAKNLQQDSGVRKRSSRVEALPAGRNTHSKQIAVDGGLRWSYGSDPSTRVSPMQQSSSVPTRLSLWPSLSTLLSISTTLLISLQKQEGALGQEKRHMVTLCARVSSCQSFCVHQSDWLLGP